MKLNTLKLLLILSIIFLLAGVSNIIMKNDSSIYEDDIKQINAFSNVLHLDSLINNSKLYYERNENELIKSQKEIVLLHTLRATSCHNCPHDNRYLISYIDSVNADLRQMIWFVDDIEPYSKNLAKQFSDGRSYILGYENRYDTIFLDDFGNYLLDRNILVFKNGILDKKIVLPYNLEFGKDSLLTIINNKINEAMI